MKTRLSTRLLSVLLVCALVLGMASPAAAMGSKSSVTFTQVDNSAVSVNPLTREDGELNTMDEYIATDVVRVSIVLEKALEILSANGETAYVIGEIVEGEEKVIL